MFFLTLRKDFFINLEQSNFGTGQRYIRLQELRDGITKEMHKCFHFIANCERLQ